MYLHLGQDVMIRGSELVAILDSSILDISEETKQFFGRLRAMGHVQGDSRLSKSMIITDHKIYFSKISATTLGRRGHTSLMTRTPEMR